ncbi:hypothetical protein N9L24_03460, partial [Candidatus Marinamargulisbacteria bacterium]|nr:hypothetical protein [Candidatus Marinamargulisbacteria bacterium]
MTQFIDNAIVERSDDWAYQSVDQIIQQSLSVIQDPDEGASVQRVAGASVDTVHVSSESGIADAGSDDSAVWRSFILDTIHRTVTALGQAYGVDTVSVDHIQRVLSDTRALDQVQISSEWSESSADRVEAAIVRATQRALLNHRLGELGIAPYTEPPSAASILYPSDGKPVDDMPAVSVSKASVDTAVLQAVRHAGQMMSGAMGVSDWIALADALPNAVSVVDAPDYFKSVAVMLGVNSAGESVQGIVFPDADGVQRMITTVNLVDLDAPIESVHASKIRPAILRYSDTAMVVEGPIPGLGVRMVDRTPIVSEAIAVDAGRLGQVIATEQTQGRHPMAFIDPDAAEVVSLVNDWQASGYVQTGMTESEIMTAVHRYVADKIQYQSDVGDQWQTVAQTLARGAGDCEDMAILVASLAARALHMAGMDDLAATVRLEAGLLADGSVGHMVARVGDQWVVDATQAVAIQDRAAVAMDSVYVLGMTGVQQTGRLDQVARLKRVGTSAWRMSAQQYFEWRIDTLGEQSGLQDYQPSYALITGPTLGIGTFSGRKALAIHDALNGVAYNAVAIRTALEGVEWSKRYDNLKRVDDGSSNANSMYTSAYIGWLTSEGIYDDIRLSGVKRVSHGHYNLSDEDGLLDITVGQDTVYFRDERRVLTTTEINYLTSMIMQQPSQLEINRREAIYYSSTGNADMPLFSGIDQEIALFNNVDDYIRVKYPTPTLSPEYQAAIRYIFNEAGFSGKEYSFTSGYETVIDAALNATDNISGFKKILIFALKSTLGDDTSITKENIEIAVERAQTIYTKQYGYISTTQIDAISKLKNYLVGKWIYNIDYTQNPYQIVYWLHEQSSFREDEILDINGDRINDYTSKSVIEAAKYAALGNTNLSGAGHITETGYTIYRILVEHAVGSQVAAARARFANAIFEFESPTAQNFLTMLSTALFDNDTQLHGALGQGQGINGFDDSDKEQILLSVALELAKQQPIIIGTDVAYGVTDNSIKDFVQLMSDVLEYDLTVGDGLLNFDGLDDSDRYDNDGDAIWHFFFNRLHSHSDGSTIDTSHMAKASFQTLIAGYMSSKFQDSSDPGYVEYMSKLNALQGQIININNYLSNMETESVEARLNRLTTISNSLKNDSAEFTKYEIGVIRAFLNSNNFEINTLNVKEAIFMGLFRYEIDQVTFDGADIDIQTIITKIKQFAGLSDDELADSGVDWEFKTLLSNYVSAHNDSFMISLTNFINLEEELTSVSDYFADGVDLDKIVAYLNSVVVPAGAIDDSNQFINREESILDDTVIDSLSFLLTNRTTDIDYAHAQLFVNELSLFSGESGAYMLTDDGSALGSLLETNLFELKNTGYTTSQDTVIWGEITGELFFEDYFLIINDKIIQKQDFKPEVLNTIINQSGLSDAAKDKFKELLVAADSFSPLFDTSQKEAFQTAYDATKSLQLIENNADPSRFKNYLKTMSLTDEKVMSMIQPTVAQIKTYLSQLRDDLEDERLIVLQSSGAFSNAILLPELSGQLGGIGNGVITESSFSVIREGNESSAIIDFLKNTVYLIEETSTGSGEYMVDSDTWDTINWDTVFGSYSGVASLTEIEQSLIRGIVQLAKTKQDYKQSINTLVEDYIDMRSSIEAFEAFLVQFNEDNIDGALSDYDPTLDKIKRVQSTLNELQLAIYNDMRINVINKFTTTPFFEIDSIDEGDTWVEQDVAALLKYYRRYIANNPSIPDSEEALLKASLLGSMNLDGLTAVSERVGELHLIEDTHIYDYYKENLSGNGLTVGNGLTESNFRSIVYVLQIMGIVGEDKRIPSSFSVEDPITTEIINNGSVPFTLESAPLDDYDFEYVTTADDVETTHRVFSKSYDSDANELKLYLSIDKSEYILVTGNAVKRITVEFDGETTDNAATGIVRQHEKTIEANNKKVSAYGIFDALQLEGVLGAREDWESWITGVLDAIKVSQPITYEEFDHLITAFELGTFSGLSFISYDDGYIQLKPSEDYDSSLMKAALCEAGFTNKRAAFISAIFEDAYQSFNSLLTTNSKKRLNTLLGATTAFTNTRYKEQQQVKQKFDYFMDALFEAYYHADPDDPGLLYFFPPSDSSLVDTLEAYGYTVPSYDPLSNHFTMDPHASILMNAVKLQQVQREIFLSVTAMRTNLQHLMNEQAKLTAFGLIVQAYLFTHGYVKIGFTEENLKDGDILPAVRETGLVWKALTNDEGDREELEWMPTDEDGNYSWDIFKENLRNNDLNWEMSLPSDYAMASDNPILNSIQGESGIPTSVSRALADEADKLTSISGATFDFIENQADGTNFVSIKDIISLEFLKAYVHTKQTIENAIKAAPSAMVHQLSIKSGIQQALLSNSIATSAQSGDYFALSGVKRMVDDALKMKHVLNFLYYLISESSNRTHLFLSVLYNTNVESVTPASAEFDASELSEMLSSVYSNRIAVIQQDVAAKSAELSLNVANAGGDIVDMLWNDPMIDYHKNLYNEYLRAIQEVSKIMTELDMGSAITAVADQAKAITALTKGVDVSSVSAAKQRIEQQYNSMVTYERSQQMEDYMVAMTELINMLLAPVGVDTEMDLGEITLDRDVLQHGVFNGKNEHFNSAWLDEGGWSTLEDKIREVLGVDSDDILTTLLLNGRYFLQSSDMIETDYEYLGRNLVWKDDDFDKLPPNYTSYNISVVGMVEGEYGYTSDRTEGIVLKVTAQVPQPLTGTVSENAFVNSDPLIDENKSQQIWTALSDSEGANVLDQEGNINTDKTINADNVEEWVGELGLSEEAKTHVLSILESKQTELHRLKQQGFALFDIDNKINDIFYKIGVSQEDYSTLEALFAAHNANALNQVQGKISDDGNSGEWGDKLDEIKAKIGTLYSDSDHEEIQNIYNRKIEDLRGKLTALRNSGNIGGTDSKSSLHVRFGSPDDAAEVLSDIMGDKATSISSSSLTADVLHRPMFDVDEAKLLGVRDGLIKLYELIQTLSLLLQKINTRYRRIMEALYGHASGSRGNNLLSMVSDNKDFLDSVLSVAEDAVGNLKNYVNQAVSTYDAFVTATIDNAHARIELGLGTGMAVVGLAGDAVASSLSTTPAGVAVTTTMTGLELSAELARMSEERKAKLAWLEAQVIRSSDTMNMGDVYSYALTGDPEIDESLREQLYLALSEDQSIVGNSNGYSALNPQYINDIRKKLELIQKMRMLRIDMDMRRAELMEVVLKALYNVSPDGYLDQLKSILQYRSGVGLTIFQGIQRDMQDAVERKNKEYEKAKRKEEINAKYESDRDFAMAGAGLSMIPVFGTMAQSAERSAKVAKAMATAIKNLVKRISHAVSSAAKYYNNNFEPLLRFGMAFKAVKSGASSLIDSVKSGASSLFEAVESFKHRAYKYYDDNFEPLLRFGMAFKAVKSGASSLIDSVKSGASSLFEAVESFKHRAYKYYNDNFEPLLRFGMAFKAVKSGASSFAKGFVKTFVFNKYMIFNTYASAFLKNFQSKEMTMKKGDGSLQYSDFNQSIELNNSGSTVSTKELEKTQKQELDDLVELASETQSDAARAIFMAVLMDTLFEHYQQNLVNVLNSKLEEGDKAYTHAYNDGLGTYQYHVNHSKISGIGVKLARQQASLHVGQMVAMVNVRIMDAVSRTLMGAPSRNRTAALREFASISQRSIWSSLDQVKQYMKARVDLENRKQTAIRESKEAKYTMIGMALTAPLLIVAGPAVGLAATSIVRAGMGLYFKWARANSARSDFDSEAKSKQPLSITRHLHASSPAAGGSST